MKRQVTELLKTRLNNLFGEMARSRYIHSGERLSRNSMPDYRWSVPTWLPRQKEGMSREQ